ncbi:MAG: DUF1003 domain-containing protein [Planctomycetota bacterium]|nr:DUF1003 domain-containing protein [Planctomycetota bacterium]
MVPSEPTGAPERACQICGSAATRTLRPSVIVRPSVADIVRRDTGAWDEDGWVCAADLQTYRHKYVQEVLQAERGALSTLDEEVLESLKQHEILASNPDEEFDQGRTLGGRVADRVASFGGSWRFLLAFGLVLVVWMAVNAYLLASDAFDPYPFILLNLVLSSLAAIQAPVIMMSQNQQAARDRQRALVEYQVSLKAELEIRHLHQKMDHLLTQQWERLVEIQQIQMDVIQEIRGRA